MTEGVLSTRGTCGRVRQMGLSMFWRRDRGFDEGECLTNKSSDMHREGCVWENTCHSGNTARARRGHLDFLVTEPQGWDAQAGGEKG